jgi:hypothetical protein
LFIPPKIGYWIERNFVVLISSEEVDSAQTFGLRWKQVQPKKKCHLPAEFLHTNGCGRRKSKLAWMEVKRGWYHSRYCREDLSQWLEVVASLEVEKKRRKLRLIEGKKKLEKRWFLSNFAY